MSNLYDIDISNDPDVIEAEGQAGQAQQTLILGAQVTGAISNLNGLLAPAQLFASSGGISIVSAGNTHTFSFSFSGTVAIANGGTGATTAANARTNLGLGALAVLNASAASADTAPAQGVAYVQADVQAILTELRDLKTKLRAAAILAP